MRLKFSAANAKTQRLAEIPELAQYLQGGKRKVYSLDLPAGYSCPGAKDCLSKCVNGKIVDGPDCKFRCFSASQEVTYPNVHASRVHNFELIRGCKDALYVRKLLELSLPKNAGIVRYHVSGDFFKRSYLLGAIYFSIMRPDVLFYGYTKSLHFVFDMRNDCADLSRGIVRDNFLLTASEGGSADAVIGITGMRSARVIFDEGEANGLPIDHDDSHAATAGGSFALLLHGVQPKGTVAAKAWQVIKKAGKGYSR